MSWRVAAIAVLMVSGCRCQRGPVDPIELGLRVSPSSVDFGRVLEDDTKTMQVSLTAITRAAISVTLSTEGPFSVDATAEVPGGGETLVPVVFTAGDGVADGRLLIRVDDKTTMVALRGTGVRPPTCMPSMACRVSTYDLDLDQCVESVSRDDVPCDTGNLCLEQGRCRSGQCLGVARRCADDDVCTDDACSVEVGCVRTPHVCPAPSAACQVATCDRVFGCGVGPAPDLTPCGTLDCKKVHFCVLGACHEEPTPDGVPCSPPLACLPEGKCRQQQCERPEVGDWSPDWAARLTAEPTGALGSSGTNLFFSVCQTPPDAGDADAGDPDAGHPLVCGLASYTGTGFERFVTPYLDDVERSFVSVSEDGVVVRGNGRLEVRSPVTGELRDGWPFDGTPQELTVARREITFIHDGGLLAWRDGGVRWLASIDKRPTALARSEALYGWDRDGGVLTRFVPLDDGGVEADSVLIIEDAGAAISVAGMRILLGGEGVYSWDAGFRAFDPSDVTRVVTPESLTSELATDQIVERCDAGCSLWVRSFDPQTGAQRWESQITYPQLPGEFIDATLVDATPGMLGVVVRVDGDGGSRAEVQLYAEGERKGICRLPPLSTGVEKVHFTASAMVLTARRPDGGLVLESYSLGALPISRSGWPTTGGVNGSRSDRP